MNIHRKSSSDPVEFFSGNVEKNPEKWKEFFQMIKSIEHVGFGVTPTGGTALWKIRVHGKRRQIRFSRYDMCEQRLFYALFTSMFGMVSDKDIKLLGAVYIMTPHFMGNEAIFDGFRSEFQKHDVLSEWDKIMGLFREFIAQGHQEAVSMKHKKDLSILWLKRSIQSAFLEGVDPEDIKTILMELAVESVVDA